MQTVFQYSTMACDSQDIPDDAARAFRDYMGVVHLIASHSINRAMTGPDVNHVQQLCNIIYEDSNSADPSTFDDMGWLETYYTEDGINVYAMVALDYHPYRHNLPCGTTPADADNCWYGTDIAATSSDGGYSFVSPAQGAPRLIAGSPYQFDSTYTATSGAFVPSNIVKRTDGYYYVVVSMVGRGVQKTGDCVLRTQNLADPQSWRAWDGTGYTIQFVDPYPTPPANPAANACTVVSAANLISPMRNLLELPNQQGYLGILYSQNTDSHGNVTFNTYSTTSLDLINWTAPVLILSLPETLGTSPSTYAYPSLIDPNSTSRNFNTMGSSGYLYLTHLMTGYDRDLVRYPVTISGLQ